MKQAPFFGRLGWVLLLALAAVLGILIGLSPAHAAGTVDMQIEAAAPTRVSMGSEYLVRLAYYNYGTQSPTDAWVTATLPTGVTFIAATDRWDNPLPPDAVDGNTLTWVFVSPHCYLTDANCGHILLRVAADEALDEGTVLTTTAVVATSDVETDLTNNDTTITTTISEMAGSGKRVQKGLAFPADVLLYTITVDLSLDSGVEERWVTITDTLPFSHQVRFLGWEGTVTPTMIDPQTFMWQARVSAGTPLQLQYRVGVEGGVVPGDLITTAAQLRWSEGHLQLGPATTVITIPHGMVVVGPDHGAELEHRYGVEATIPPGAVSDVTRIECNPITDTMMISPPGGLFWAHRAIEMKAVRFGEPVGNFYAPITITMHFTDTDVTGLKRETLRLWARTGPAGRWEPVVNAVETPGAFTFSTTSFTQYALFAEPKYRFHLPLCMR